MTARDREAARRRRRSSRMKRIAFAVAAALLASLPVVASADAAKDLKDIRGGQLPIRYAWLGWSGDTAHFRTLVCSEGGTTACTAEIVKQTSAKTDRAPLLSVQEVYCDGKSPCAALDAVTASSFVKAERIADAALPSLTAGASFTDPSRAFGPVAGEPTTVSVRAHDVTEDGNPRLIVDLVLNGKGGAVERLGILSSTAFRLNGSSVLGTHVSPDGKTAAFAVRIDYGVMCWDFSALPTVVVDVARKRSSLANTIGWRAYRKGDIGASLAAFTEATSLDGSYGLGWYNRASVESRNGTLASAKTSLEAALKLDPAFARRACKDPDFNPLRAAEPSLLHC
jgi:hypothetical protein